MKVGYYRCSTDEQNPARQVDVICKRHRYLLFLIDIILQSVIYTSNLEYKKTSFL